jgi:hypothetical protein
MTTNYLVLVDGQPSCSFTLEVDALAHCLSNLQGAEVQIVNFLGRIKFLKRYPGQDKFSRSCQQIVTLRHNS